MLDLVKRNDALKSNPVMAGIGIHITKHGSDWLWAAFAIFALFCVVHGLLFLTSYKSNLVKKNFLLIPILTNVTFCIAYFTSASNLGYASQVAEFHHIIGNGNYVRQIFYTKFIAWFVAWPPALLAITIATSTLSERLTHEFHQNVFELLGTLAALFLKIIVTEVFVLGLLVGCLIHSTYKWGFFTIACVALLFAFTLLILSVVESIKSAKGSRNAAIIIAFQIVVWSLYPVCWALSEGGNVIQPDSEAVFYGILDVITFCFIPTALTWINVSTTDDDFFLNFFAGVDSHQSEKISNSPRNSGDTAVPNQDQLGQV